MGIFRPARSRALFVVGLMASAAASNPVLAQPPIDLSLLGTTHPGFRIDGVDAGDNAGFSVSGAGDINGDGLADLIVGAPNANSATGESYVVFGRTDGTAVDLSLIGTAHPGFRIDGIGAGDSSDRSVSGAGDVNGDGLADLIVGAQSANSAAGECYVIFGKADGTAVDLSLIGTTHPGFRIDGIDPGDRSGFSVSGAGDVNGDGLADLIVGAPNANSATGESYVVFGRTDGTAVDLSLIGTTHPGFRIDGIDAYDHSGSSVSGAGDVNGDGLADLLVGAPRADPGGNGDAGESYVVFGKADGTAVDLSLLGTTHPGFRIDGIDGHDYSGRSGLSGAGDVNGDGLADVIVGAASAYPFAKTGKSYVVFGKTDGMAVDLSLLGATHPGFRIDGIAGNDFSGRSVSGAGDVDGDGLADLLVGAPGVNSTTGESYVVFGKADGTAVELSLLGTAHPGFRIDGIDANDASGWSVSGAGDVDGDGLADLLVGAHLASSLAGESYVVFSPMTAPATATYKSARGAGAAPLSPVGVSGDGSNESTPDSRAWIGFADGDAASMQTVTIRRNQNLGATFLPTVWSVSTDRTGWTNATLKVKYTEAEVTGLTEADLVLYKADSIGGPYAPLTTTVDPAKNTVSADVSSFSFFAIGTEAVQAAEFDGFVVE